MCTSFRAGVCFHFSWVLPQSRIARSCGKTIFNHLRNCQTLCQRDYHFPFLPAVHKSYKFSTSFPTPVIVHLFDYDILMHMKWYLIVIQTVFLFIEVFFNLFQLIIFCSFQCTQGMPSPFSQEIDNSALAFISSIHGASRPARGKNLGPSQILTVHVQSPQYANSLHLQCDLMNSQKYIRVFQSPDQRHLIPQLFLLSISLSYYLPQILRQLKQPKS